MTNISESKMETYLIRNLASSYNVPNLIYQLYLLKFYHLYTCDIIHLDEISFFFFRCFSRPPVFRMEIRSSTLLLLRNRIEAMQIQHNCCKFLPFHVEFDNIPRTLYHWNEKEENRRKSFV